MPTFTDAGRQRDFFLPTPCPALESFKAPHSIQPQEHSTGSGMDGAVHYFIRNADGNRLNLGRFDDDGLNCDNWNWDDNRNGNLGCFSLMVRWKKRKTDCIWRSVFPCLLSGVFQPSSGNLQGLLQS